MLTRYAYSLHSAPPGLRHQLHALARLALSPQHTLLQLDLTLQSITYWHGSEFVSRDCEEFLDKLRDKLQKLALPLSDPTEPQSFFLTMDYPMRELGSPTHSYQAIRLQPLEQDERGQFTAFLGLVAPSSYPLRGGPVRLHQLGSSVYWTTAELGLRWHEHPLPKIEAEEKRLLSFISQGLTEEQIAQTFCLSKAAIKKRKARICEKLNVNNCSLALLRILREHLLC